MYRRPLVSVGVASAAVLWYKNSDLPGTALTSGQVRQVLGRNCTTFKGPKDSLISHAHFNAVQSNDPIEDTHSESYFNYGSIVGVYDGHSGTECSAILETYLSAYVAKEISDISDKSSIDERKKNVCSAIERAFTRLDNDLLEGRILTLDMPKSWFSWWSSSNVDSSLILKNLRNAMYTFFSLKRIGRDPVHYWLI